MSKTNKKRKIVVYTDGSCIGNGKDTAVGGIGIHFPNKELADISKSYKGVCTNQRTELFAILTSLRYIKQNFELRNLRVCIKTDSQYSINCVTKWVYGWIKNGWKTKNNTPVINKELIELIHKYYEHYDIIFEHVDAHTNLNNDESRANAIADKLAVDASKRAMAKNPTNRRLSTRSSKHYGRSQLVNPLASKSNSNIVVELIKSKH